MKIIIYLFLMVSLMIGGFILQVEQANYNTSSWNFTGAPIAVGIKEYSGAFLVLIGLLVFMIKGARS